MLFLHVIPPTSCGIPCPRFHRDATGCHLHLLRMQRDVTGPLNRMPRDVTDIPNGMSRDVTGFHQDVTRMHRDDISSFSRAVPLITILIQAINRLISPNPSLGGPTPLANPTPRQNIVTNQFASF